MSRIKYRKIHILGTALTVVFLFTVPWTAHAQALTANFTTNSLLQSLLSGLSVLTGIQGWLLLQLSDLFSTLSRWQIASNNVVVFDAWEIARDIVNLFFIVGMVIISFATIFRATNIGFLQRFHWRTALPKLLIAAILVNLSLGLSESVVLVSNRVTTILADVMANSSARITNIMQVGTLMANGVTITDPSIASQNLGNITGSRAPDGTEWDAYLAIAENRTEEEEKALQACLNEETDLGFFEGWFRDPVRKSIGECNHELGMARRGETEVSFADRAAFEFLANNTPTGLLSLMNSPTQRITLLVAGLFNVALLTLLIISLGTAVVFFFLRIAALWVLMFFSAFAFGFYWYDPDLLKKWWNQFLGWNVFGPLYMLILLFGLTFLARQGDLMANLNQGNETGLVPLLASTLFFFIMAFIIFIGGLNFAYRSSFAEAVRETNIIGGIAERYGTFGAIRASQWFGQRAGQLSGVTPTYQAAKERAAQTAQAIGQRVLPQVSDEERLGRARTRLGVYRGAPGLIVERIKTQRAALENQVNAIPDRKQQTAFLREQINDRDRGTALAARQILLSKGQLSADEIKRTQQMYPGGIAQAEFARNLRDTSTAAANPQALFEYRKQEITDNDPERDRKLANLRNEVFGSALKNPNTLVGLGDEYFMQGKKEFDALKQAVDRQYPPGDKKARAKAYARFDRAAKTAQQEEGLRALFKQESVVDGTPQTKENVPPGAPPTPVTSDGTPQENT